MLGGLYGDLPPPSSDEPKNSSSTATASSTSTATSVWSTAAKFAPPTLRKPSSVSAPQTLLKPKSIPPKPSPAPAPAPVLPRPPSPDAAVAPPANLVAVTSTIVDEYDPARPNDYEDYRRERRRKAAEAERLKEIERLRIEEEERELRRSQRDDRDRDRDRDRGISGEEAWKRRAAMSGGGGRVPRSPSPPANIQGIGEGSGANEEGDSGGFSIGKSETVGLGVGAGGQMTAAQRMMAKMGWKEGQGLGKQEQGMTTPLMAKKTDRRAGVIVNASETKGEKKVKSVNFNGPPTRVLLLRNMVGPGEVDDELEEEVGSECTKYGKVTRVLIFEITEPNFPADEAVRIFVEFERSEETTKALVDLDGRFFGGRVVRATFYDEDRFGKNDLAPLPGEVPGF
ncbi:hypothetical protein MLD38_016668 [Melastoma candidum]|uniref:Uncharacterized protein n=1 Tax=Melastoma candidum TaxID=119954 RepID=A0ACB9QWC4_9MYRT|nr:hypothetical protein MLD38_016668 [Melastoma candidum]